MRDHRIIPGIVTLALVIGGGWYLLRRDGITNDLAGVAPSASVVAASSTREVPDILPADLYFSESDCEGDARFSSLDVDPEAKNVVYESSEGLRYAIAGDAEDTMVASVQRGEGCENLDESLEISSYSATPLSE